ncbi:hypothetical protein [Pedobacter gandavensis]|uniref:Uncharacterized protein n=1 Tax=Pedobacter gandavensis TaxID=2679963 RepID=A0ABR6EV86_9SPHI|nr:hypothetical protein [Pedobacter gandavensis]MBB2149180.1 hypothetical protein [Pedobacter gandavensis]
MSVSLTTSPAAIAFSADQIFAKFTCTNYIQQLGDFSVNELDVLQPMIPGTSLRIRYSGVDISMMASPNPDDTGKEFLSGTSSSQALLPYFKSNYSLSRDFEITAPASNKIRFTARTKKLGYNFTGNTSAYFSLINRTPGTVQILRPKYAVFFRLYIENKDNTGFNLFYTTKLPILGGNGQTEISIGDKLHNEIMMDLRSDFSDIPQDHPLLCKASCRKYYFEFAESFGDVEEVKKIQKSPEFTVLHGGLSYVAQFNSTMLSLIAPGAADTDRFLKQGNVTVYTRTNQPQYLYFFNTRASAPGAVIRAKFHLKDGTEVLKSLGTFDLETLRKYAFNLRFDDITTPNEFAGQRVIKYEVWLETAAGEKRSEIRTYFMNFEYREFARYFLSWSSFGSLDSHLCYGKGNSEFELFQKDATKTLPFGYDIKHGNSISFDLKLKSSFKVATGWMSKREMLLNRDFFLSPFKYRYTGGLMLPIKIESKTISENKDGENLYSQLFDYSYQFEDHNFTEGDNEDSGVSAGDFFFNSDPVIGNPADGLTEKDPTVPRWVKSITQSDIDRWNAGGSGGGGGDFSNYYTKLEIKNLYAGFPAIEGYNKSNWDNSFSWGNHAGLYQPLENQRLSTQNLVDFNEITATNKLFIPATGTRKWKIYVDEQGSGGGAIAPPVVSSLWDLTNTLRSGSEQNNQVLSYDALTGRWTNKTINVDVDLSSYAKRDGSNVNGNWNINILGNAYSATMWGGQEFSGGSTNLTPNYLLGAYPGGKSWYVDAFALRSFIGSPPGGETWQSVMNRGSGISNTAFFGGNSRPTGNISGKAVYIEQSGGYGTVGSYDFDWSVGVPLLIQPAGGTVSIGYTTDKGYTLAVNGRGIFNGGVFNEGNESTYGLRVSDSRALDKGILLGHNPLSNIGFISSIHDGVAWQSISINPNGGNLMVGFSTDQGYNIAVNGSGLFTRNILISGDYGQGYQLEDGFGINRRPGWTQFTYQNIERLAIDGNGIQVNGQSRSTDGFKSYTHKGIAGDYDANGTTDKIIWTIGDSWNEVTAMYGIGYSYATKYGNAHQIVFRLAGNVKASIVLSDGSAYFDGSVTAPVIKATNKLFIPEKDSGGQPNGVLWQIYIQRNQ